MAKLIRASRGPVLLMTLGALLAINQFSRFTFDQTFPVLIIVFGMMWLLERMVPRQLDPTTVGGPRVSSAPPLPQLLDRGQPLYDPLTEVHRRVYGDPVRASGAPAPVNPAIDPRELPTAEHPVRQQQQSPSPIKPV